jgi:hypothetical protein
LTRTHLFPSQLEVCPIPNKPWKCHPFWIITTDFMVNWLWPFLQVFIWQCLSRSTAYAVSDWYEIQDNREEFNTICVWKGV